MDGSEFIDKDYWGQTFREGGFNPYPISLWHDGQVYKHAIIRDPIARLISAYVNKLSCGLYSVPAGRDGSEHASRTDQATWREIVEPHADRYARNVASFGELRLTTQQFEFPCVLPETVGRRSYLDREPLWEVCDPKRGNRTFARCACDGISLEQFADAMLHIHSRWPKAPQMELDGHFRPQVGKGSCFDGASPEDYDVVSTISDTAALRTFSQHLPSHKLGLWGDTHIQSNSHGDLYFEGKPWMVPAAVIAKLKEATKIERERLGRFYAEERVAGQS